MKRGNPDTRDQIWNLGQIGPRLAQIGRQAYSSEGLIWTLIGLGILLRVAQYVANRSLWLDEIFLALNIINRSWAGLLRPLDYGQGAPLGFLILEKLAVQALGNTEYALRLVPLIFGLISLVLFYEVARRSIKPGAVPIALGLFAVLNPLIYYSSETKQYSGDVAIALFLFSSTRMLWESGRLSVPRTILLAIAGVFAIWFSHPALFILMGVGTVALMVLFRTGDWVRIGRFSVVALTWILSLGLLYYVSLRYLRTDPDLLDYWRSAFLPFPPSLSSLRWLGGTFFQVLDYPVGFSALPGLAALPCLVGAVSLWSESRVTFLALMLPLFFTLAASAFRLYPFGGRLVLFAVPFIVLLIAHGTERIVAATKGQAPMIGGLLIVLLFFHPLLTAGSSLVKPRTVEEIRPVLAYLRTHEENGDALYLYYGSGAAFKFYSAQYGFEAGSYINGVTSREDWKKYAADLERLRGKRRVWVLFSHVWKDEKDFFLYYLDTLGMRVDSFQRDGAEVYLYDLTRKD